MQLRHFYRLYSNLLVLLITFLSSASAQSPLQKWVHLVKTADSSQLLTRLYDFPRDYLDSSKAAIEMLKLLKDPNPSVRAGIAIQLGEIKLLPKVVVPKLILLMEDKDRKVREQAVVALSKYDTHAIPSLIKLLKNRRVVDTTMRVGKDRQTYVLIADLAMIGLINCKSIDPKQLFDVYATSFLSNVIKYIITRNKYISLPDLIPYLTSGNPIEKQLALISVGALGSATSEAISLVADLTNARDKLTKDIALKTLPALGSKALSAIGNILQQQHLTREQRQELVSNLDYIGVESLPLLNKMVVNDPDDEVRITAARTMTHIKRFTIATGQTLSSLLMDRNTKVAEEASRALNILLDDTSGSQPSIVPELIKALRSPSGNVQSDAAYLLGKMKDLDKYSDVTVEEMLAGLSRPAAFAIKPNKGFSNKSTEEQFITAIGEIKIKDPQLVIPVFAAMLSADSLKRIHATIIETLGKLGNVSSPLVPLIITRSTGINIYPVLANIEPAGVDNLIDIATSGTYADSIRTLSIRALGDASPSAQRLHPLLKNLLVNMKSSFQIRNAASEALFLLGLGDGMTEQILEKAITFDTEKNATFEVLERSKKKDIPFIIHLFHSVNSNMRESFLNLLWQLGPDSLIDEVLVAALNDKDEDIREKAGELLMKSDPEYVMDLTGSQQLADSLAKLIQSEISIKTEFDDWKSTAYGGTRVTQPILPAFAILSMLGPHARPALPVLIPLLHHPNNRVRLETIKTIGDIGIDSLGAGYALNTLLIDRNIRIQAAAANTLALLQPEAQFNNPVFAAVCIDGFVSRHFRNHYDDIADRLRPSGLVSGRLPAGIPPFPWPPPQYSHKAKFGVELPLHLLGNYSTTLSAVYLKLVNALNRTDLNFEQGLFGVPGGFALLAKMERIHEDGTPLPGKYRWVMGKIPPLTLADYIGQLFFENCGYFRIIAFVFTDDSNFGYSNKKLPDIKNGGHDFPPELVNKTLESVNGYVLIYSFKRINGGGLSDFVQMSALNHLVSSGIYNNMTY